MKAHRSRFTKVRGSQAMHVVRCGSGDPILFIHGMPTSSRLWSGVMRRLCARFSCFAVDLPGMGQTPYAGYGPDYLRSLAEQLDALRRKHNIEKWHVVGHDAGAVVAVHYARYFPAHVDHLALLSPALFPELRPFYLLGFLRKRFVGEILAPFVQVAFWKIAMQRALAGDSDGSAALEDFHAPFAGFAGSWQFMRLMRWGKAADLLAEVPAFLPLLDMPTLVFHGRRDPAIPEEFARRASALIPNASMVTLDSGHFLPLHQPESVALSLAQFFGPSPSACAQT
jgi:pimeloyl-ACP methyl ester carboxylesterase